MAHPRILAFVLAGGRGKRLFPLTSFRSKPAVPFGGRYRIVDFVLSNLVNSRIYSIYLLVQYQSQSLIEHVRQNWVLAPVLRDHFITVVPPQMRTGPEWFEGTADAVFQNINLIREFNPELVAVFGADHIYRMDIRQMIDFHLSIDAEVTIAARPVPIEEASSFGVIVSDSEYRIVNFQEKPRQPASMHGDPNRAYVSMGNYVFNRKVLEDALARAERKKQNDFGSHVLPDIIETGKVFAYDFSTNIIPGTTPHEEKGYWRDVGNISAFFNANMDILGRSPNFEIDNEHWPIHPSRYEGPSARIWRGDIKNSVLAEGVFIEKARVVNSIIRSGVTIESGVSVEDCIIMDGTMLKRGCGLKRVIVDKMNIIEVDERIGFDTEADRFRCHIDSSGIAIVPRGGRAKRMQRGM